MADKTLAMLERGLLQHDWPGNLRELHHSIERATILTPEPAIGASAFRMNGEQSEGNPDMSGNLHNRLMNYEYQIISETLHRHEFHINETASELGISRKNLWEKMKKLGISKQD